MIPKRTEQWLWALIAAGISGGTSAGLSALGISGANAVGIEIKQFDAKQFWAVVGSGALVGVFMYLRQSPIPPMNGTQPIARDENAAKTPPTPPAGH